MKEFNEYKPDTFVDQLMFDDLPFLEEIWITLLEYKEQNDLKFDMLKMYKDRLKYPAYQNLHFLDSRYITNLAIVEYTPDVRRQLLNYYSNFSFFHTDECCPTCGRPLS